MKQKKILMTLLYVIILFTTSLMSNAQSVNNHFYSVSPSGIGDHNTISSGPDNGANNNMAALFWRSMRHSTTEQAVNNWLSRLGGAFIKDEILNNAGNLNIGGHGNEGLLETGPGQTGQYDYKTNFLVSWNKAWWEPFLIKLRPKNFPIIYIYSCHTGAGEAGAEFLYQMAVVTKHPVAARTGFTYTNNQRLWFENGSVWQVATPDHKPAPIAAPTPHFTKINKLKLYSGNTLLNITEDQIMEIKIEKTNAVIAKRGNQETVIEQAISSKIIKDLFASEPFKIEGTLLATKTQQITIKISGSSENILVFDVYNNRIIADKFANYYYISENAAGFLK